MWLIITVACFSFAIFMQVFGWLLLRSSKKASERRLARTPQKIVHGSTEVAAQLQKVEP